MRRVIVTGLLLAGLWLAQPTQARAQDWNMNPYFYYPYHFFPHNYWPQNGPVWPERPGELYRKPPAYMAYPAFHEPHWRYDLHQPMKYYRGFHFWLDQF
jgi:hypothetical protein